LSGDEFCPLERVVDLIDGKWKVLILWYLRNGCLRFSQLQRKIPQATRKMLTQQLRQLETAGLIRRAVYAEVPPRVEYSLTQQGESLKELLLKINDWGDLYYGLEGARVEDSLLSPSFQRE
jgi:DNA-binding HxlR family transcriptional regulator